MAPIGLVNTFLPLKEENFYITAENDQKSQSKSGFNREVPL